MGIDEGLIKQVAEVSPLPPRLPIQSDRASTSAPVGDAPAAGSLPPPLMHGNDWHGQDVAGWWCSEKYKGLRAYWTGQWLLSTEGQDYRAPGWFVSGLPVFALDCELWLGRGPGEVDVRRAIAAGEWERIKLVVFDIPDMMVEGAIATLRKLTLKPPAIVADHWQVGTTAGAKAAMRHIVANGGEGVMLRKPHSRYRAKRTSDLLKLKP
jgi:DNA ligase 1